MSDADSNGTDQSAYDVGFESAVADIITIKALLMDNHPLEALKLANEAEERHKPNLPEQSLHAMTNQGGQSDE